MNMKVTLAALLLLISDSAFGAETIEVSRSMIFGVWLAICCAMVLFMQAGFLMLEGGMVRSKNAINVILKNFTDIGLGSIGFWVIGVGLMYGANESGWIGTSSFLTLPDDTSSALNLLYQMMFAATAATIMSGAVAERFSFLPYIVGAFFVTAIIYPVFGSWAWGGSGENLGWLRDRGFYDMAGGTVVLHLVRSYSLARDRVATVEKVTRIIFLAITCPMLLLAVLFCGSVGSDLTVVQQTRIFQT